MFHLKSTRYLRPQKFMPWDRWERPLLLTFPRFGSNQRERREIQIVMADPYETYKTFSALAQGGPSGTGADISFEMDSTKSKTRTKVQASLQNLTIPFALGGQMGNREDNLFGRSSKDKEEKKKRWLELFPSLSSDDKAKVETEIENRQVPMEQLLRITTPAPFGKGSETVIDESVRKALQVPAEIIPDGLFDDLVDTITTRVKEVMVPHGVTWEYKLYKIHIYGVNGKFESHVDTLHGSNHVATLVADLGVEHKGGELVVKHQDKETTFKFCHEKKDATETQDSSELEFVDWAVFYTDCTHEVKEVAEGWRVVVQFDIYETKEEEGGKDEEDEGTDEEDEGEAHFIEALEDLGTNPPSPPAAKKLRTTGTEATELNLSIQKYLTKIVAAGEGMAFLMRHRYAISALHEENLKGADRMIHDALMSCGWFDVALTCMVLNFSSDYGWPYSMDKVKLTPVTMHDFDNKVEKTVFPCKVARFVADYKARGNVECLKSKNQLEYTGNEAESTGHSYYSACFVVAPKKLG